MAQRCSQMSSAGGIGSIPCSDKLRRSGLARALYQRSCVRVSAFKSDMALPHMHTRVAIIGGGPSAHTAAIYTARADLEPIVFEGFMAAGIPAGGQLTTTTYVENFPGFVEPILGIDLAEKFREHSKRYGTRVFTETVTRINLRTREADPHSPFQLWTPERYVTADTVIISTGASAKRLRFPGSGDESEGGYWNRGISACAICDGASPLVRNKPVAVVGGGDSAMEEAMFLTRYASKVYVIHRFNYLEASRAMAKRALANPKIEVLWCTEVVEAHGNDSGTLGSVTVSRRPPVDAAPGTSAPSCPGGGCGPTAFLERVEVGMLFFAIGHRPATDFLEGQLALDPLGYIITTPGGTATSIPGVFAAGDVMDHKYRQAITAAGSGCMAALEAERYLQSIDLMSPVAVPAGASAAAAAQPVAATGAMAATTA